MILKSVLADGPPAVDLELHPRVTVIVSATTSDIAQLLSDVLRGVVDDAAGEVEVDGTLYDLADPDLQPVELPESVERLVLGPGDALVMFTDGAVGEGRDAMTMLAPRLEVAGGATAAGLAEAVEAAARVIEPDHTDDIAVLAVRVPAEPAPDRAFP